MLTSNHLADCIQRTPEWYEARRGLVTASRAADVLAVLKKGGEAAPRYNYRIELAIEILTKKTTDRFAAYGGRLPKAMDWGVEQEPLARAAYEMKYGVLVETCGFFVHPTVPRFGASPDGLVGSDGIIQIKCPNTNNHLEWMLEGVIPTAHGAQMLGDLACSGRAWCDFVSFDPRLPEPHQLFVRRLERADFAPQIAQLEAEVDRFNDDLDAMLAKLPKAPAIASPGDAGEWVV